MRLPRGFVKQAQQIVAEQRALVGASPTGPLDPFQLAEKHGVVTRTPEDIRSLNDDARKELLIDNASTWSALTIPAGAVSVIIYNPTHGRGRINNSICHELSHMILRHEHSKMRVIAGLPMRDFDESQEAQADRLGGMLLVPDTAIKAAKIRGWSHAETAVHLGTSEQLVRWLWAKSGVDRYMQTVYR